MAIRRQYPNMQQAPYQYPVRPPGPWNPPVLPQPVNGPGVDWYPEQSQPPYRLPDETARGMDELLRGVNPPQYPTRPAGWNPPVLPTPPNGPGVDWYPEQSRQPPIRTPPSAPSVPQSERYGAPMEPPSVPEWQPPQRLAEEEVRAAFYPYPRQPTQQPMRGAPAPFGGRSSATVPMPSVADIQGAQRKGQEFAENLRADMSTAPNFGWGSPPPITAEQIRGQNPEQLRAAGMGFQIGRAHV